MKETQPNPLKRVWHSFSSQDTKVKIAFFILLIAIITIPLITVFVADTSNTENVTIHAAGTPAITSPIQHWLFVESAAMAVKATPIGAPFIQGINNPSTYELSHLKQTNDPLPNATHVESFESYASISAALKNNKIVPGVKVILYDNEHWAGTPINEQQHPFTYVPLAEQVVHHYGYLFMNTPAADLGKLLDPSATDNYAGYLQLKLATLSQYADIFEIQAQNTPSVSEYVSFSQQAMTQARTANPKAVILLGITAKNGGPSSQELIQEVQGTMGITDGYWFNIIGGTTGVNVALPVIQALQTPSLTPTQIITPTISPTQPFITPTTTPPPGDTLLKITLGLHGIGTGGDSVNPNSQGNTSPLHPTRVVTVTIYNSQNQLVLVRQNRVMYDTTIGKFVGTFDLGTNFTSGSYTIKITTPQYLRSLIPGIQSIIHGKINSLPLVTLIAGDINGDNLINIEDYNILIGCYSDLLPATNCTAANNLLADLNDDGHVNQFDYNLFLRELANVSGQ